MLAVPADRLPDAVGDLDPGNRALLDLSLRRGVSDAEIGELLRKEPADVARGRDAVLELLADALDVNGHDRRERVREAVAALPDEAWRPRPTTPPPAPAPPSEPREEEPRPQAEEAEEPEEAEEAEEPEDEPEPTPSWLDYDDRAEHEPRRSGRAGVIVALGFAAVVVALILLLSSGDDDESDSGERNGSPQAQDGGPEPQGNSEELKRLGDGKGEGTVTVTDEGATITLRGLPKPDGNYQVWLYDSIVNAQSLGTLPRGSGELEVKLPPDARSYRFLDVSNEPADANPNHSGVSVLRAPLNNLLSG